MKQKEIFIDREANQEATQADPIKNNSELLAPTFPSLTREPPDRKTFLGLAFVCDECARPLHLYGENFIETYTNGNVNVLRCLCDLHAAELEVNGR
jgi:hypothetical protein